MTEPLVPKKPRVPMQGTLRRLYASAVRATGRHRRAGLERVRGVPLMVLDDVFNPVLFRSGVLLADAIERDLAGTSGLRVLDLGTGSGVGAIFAARAGARVVAVDVNPHAVRCARANAVMHGVEDRVEVREGDLFAPVAGERFDRVCFNPPFFRGAPADVWDRAWRSDDVFERFAAGLGDALAPGGHALVLLSTDGACAELVAELQRRGFSVAVALRRRWIGEIETVYRVSP